MKYNELLEKLWKDLEPRIRQLIKEEDDPFKKIQQLQENIEPLQKGIGILKNLGFFGGKDDKELDANDLEEKR